MKKQMEREGFLLFAGALLWPWLSPGTICIPQDGQHPLPALGCRCRSARAKAELGSQCPGCSPTPDSIEVGRKERWGQGHPPTS